MNELKARAQIDIQACLRMKEVFPHTLLEGPGGCGKTAFALAIAEELDYYSIVTEAASLRTRQQIIDCLTTAEHQAVKAGKPLLLFVDEVQRFSIPQQEVWYYPLDRKQPRITLSDKTIQLRPFTLIAATTRQDSLDQASFVKRFGNILNVQRFNEQDLRTIIKGYFNSQKILVSCFVLQYISQRSLGIPRQALRLAEKVRNFFLSSGEVSLGLHHCEAALKLEGLDDTGLSNLHIGYLQALLESGKPRGVVGIAGRLGQSVEIVSELIEPILLELGLIDRTARGRVITEGGRKYLAKFHRNANLKIF
jgi:Holliday junction DNA helicase RuvB